jgi:protein-disulfide isomerase-like protein with CxxC motif
MPSKPSFVDSIVAEIIARARTQNEFAARERRVLRPLLRRAGLTDRAQRRRTQADRRREEHRAECHALARQLRALGIPCNTAKVGWTKERGTVILLSLSKKNARRIIAALRARDI